VAELTTRVLGVAPKGAPLTNAEVDQNFLSLNTHLEQTEQSIEPIASDVALVLSIALG
jgi:hypothetical protein